MILPFHKIGRSDASKAGGKGASLGEMTQAGIPVPPGFVVLAEAFEAFIDANNVRSEIHDILEHLDHNSVTSIESSSAQIQELILAGDIPEDIQQEIQTYQKDITTDYVAVRSSATAEDGIEHAWAGQLDTYLNVPKNAIEKKIQSCWASLFTPRALFYRSEKGLVDIHISVAVIVQSMVDAESAGVAFSVHPVTENTDEIVIEGSWGLGEAVVSGEVTPDSFVISKSSREILSQHIAEKKKGIFRNKNGQNEWREIPEQERENPVLNEKALNGLSELVIHIEDHYGFPCDIEWAYAGGKIYILQARPITTLKKNEDIKKNIFEENWQIGATRNMPLWHDILCLYAWEDNMRDYGVDEKCKCLFAIENATHATMFMQTENQKKYFEATAKRCKDGKAVKKLRKKYEIYAHDVQKSLEKLMQQNSVENLKIFLKHYQRFTAGLWITTGFGRIGTENLEKALIKAGIQQEKIPEYISTLTYPEEHTPLFASQKDMLILGEKIQSGKKINRKKEILGWLENHKFIPVNFCEDPWTEEDAEKQLTDILEQDCKVALQKLNKSHRDKLKEKRRLQEELDQDISDISDALAEATSLNEYRKNIFCRLSYSIRFVFEKMMKKVGSSNWRDAYYCTPDEMVEICRGKNIDIQKIKEERQKCVLVREGDSIAWGSENIIQDYFEKIYNKNEESGETLTGFSANKGKITGRVKVVLSTRDFHKVNRGDILVTTMTSVDFVPIMEKAGAFVTNEGGITSHAAIVAREMDKPCIIGTKNATRVLQDGDLIEVDADNGVIKILEKEESLLENKDLEVWIERKQSIFSMSVFHELESKIMSEHLGGGFKTQICFMKDKVCSYIHEIGDLEHVIQNIAQKLQKKSTKDQENYIKEMNRWEKIGNKIIKDGSNPVLLSESAMREYLENYKNIGYWTTVVPYFLLEAIHALGEEKYKKLQKICERLRSNSLYPILNEKITLKVLERVSLKMGLSHEDAYYITWQETVRGLDGAKPKNKKSIGERKHKDNAFYRNQSGEVLFLDNEEEKEKLRQISYPKEANKLITGKTSYPGKVIGKVRILRTREDMQHFETGDVLVSPNSNPSLIGCIKKCSAMVTDEGGVSCHAAVISRELKIPCIIGTKNATRVLQDGDLIEVDADNGVVKILEKIKNDEWIKNVTREVTIFPAASVTKSFGRISKPFEIEFNYEHILFVGNTWYYRKSDYEKLKGILTKKIQEDSSYVQRITKKQKEVGESLKKFIKKLNSVQLSNKNLDSIVTEYDQRMTEFYAFWWIAIPVGEILEGQVRGILKNKAEIDFDELMFVRKELELVREKRLRNEIAIQCQKYKKYEDLPKILEQKLIQHAEQFGWINTSYHVGIGLSARDFFEKIQAENPEKSITELEEQRKREKKTLTKLKKQLSKKDQSTVEAMQTIMYLRNYQKETVNECQHKSEVFLQKIAREIELEWDTFLAFSATEIQQYIKNKLQRKDCLQKAKKRQREFIIEWLDGEVSVYEKDLEKYLQKVAKNESNQIKTIQGSPAYKGNISGKVRVINKKSEIELFIPGEILVTNMTSIDYIHVMGRAAAIITNEGGITCHAAIFSRELKIPCIIGTKNATEILKTGDFVEMNSENGVIKILEKKNYLENKKLLSEGGRACYLYPNRIFCTRMNIPHPLWENHLMVISTSENHKVNWYFAVDDESEFDYTLRRVLENKNMLKKGEKEINRLVRKAQKTLKKEYKTAKEAWSGYENFINIYEEIAIVPTFVRQLDRAVVRSLRESIHEEDFAVAVYPTKRTYQRQEEIALLELRTQFDDTITTDIQKKLGKIYVQYFTSGLGYFEEHVKTKSDYREKLLGNSRKDAKGHLKKIIEEEKEIMQKKEKLKKIFPQKAQIIDIAGFLVYLKDHYKFQINRVQHYAEGLFRSISALSGYDESLIRDMTPDEVKNLLLFKKIDEKNIQKRIAYHAYVYNDSGKPELILGEEVKAFTQKYLATNNLQKSFSGRVACKGQGRGKAKVILGTRDFHKMEQGDILVVMNTSPDFVPIMKKAAAIVAEEGGITGHVSVVSREFGIPSVVGIKQITSIIQDGETIEVDALKGVVTRID